MSGTEAKKYLLHTYNSSIVTIAWFIPQYLPSLPYLTVLPGRRKGYVLPHCNSAASHDWQRGHTRIVSSLSWLSGLGCCWHLSDFRIKLWSIPCLQLPFYLNIFLPVLVNGAFKSSIKIFGKVHNKSDSGLLCNMALITDHSKYTMFCLNIN